MYQAESEDLVPRSAPKPAALGLQEAKIRPSVPEISIVLNSNHDSELPSTVSSYATWKKNCLTQSVPLNRGNEQVFISKTTQMLYDGHRMDAAPSASELLSAKCDLSSRVKRTLPFSSQSSCSMDSLFIPSSQKFTVSIPCSKANYNNDQRQDVSESIVKLGNKNLAFMLKTNAGTQTETPPAKKSVECNNKLLASKEDISQIKTMLMTIQNEQIRLIGIMQQFLVHATAKTEREVHQLKDVGTQSGDPKSGGFLLCTSIKTENSTDEENSSSIRKQTNSLEGAPEIQHFRATTHPATDLYPDTPNSSTDKSMAMNELALKYLPNEKLSDLLEELNMSPRVRQNLKNENDLPVKKSSANYGKASNDLSTASYKYLKKYRLLLEENNNPSPAVSVQKLLPVNDRESMLDLEAIRHQPKFI